MKKTIITIAIIVLTSTFISAQMAANRNSRLKKPSSDITMRSEFGTENQDLISVLYFEEMGFSKLTFSGKELIGKDFLITMKEYTNGKLAKEEVVFDSKEAEQFKITENKFMFKVLSKITPRKTAKLEFQFNGFRTTKEYKIGENQKGFVLKDFTGGNPTIPIELNKSKYVLTYMMPYVDKRGWEQYCDVAQSGDNPEEFGTKYAIPTYFLFDIKFH